MAQAIYSVSAFLGFRQSIDLQPHEVELRLALDQSHCWWHVLTIQSVRTSREGAVKIVNSNLEPTSANNGSLLSGFSKIF